MDVLNKISIILKTFANDLLWHANYIGKEWNANAIKCRVVLVGLRRFTVKEEGGEIFSYQEPGDSHLIALRTFIWNHT